MKKKDRNGTRRWKDVSVHYHCCISISLFCIYAKIFTYIFNKQTHKHTQKKTEQTVAQKARPNLKYAQYELDQSQT